MNPMKVFTLVASVALIGAVITPVSGELSSETESCPSNGAECGGSGHPDGPEIDEEETANLLRQIDFAHRAGVDPVTVVVNGVVEGGEAYLRRGVVYASSDPLPAGSTAALYRALLVREDAWGEWVADGTIEKGVWGEFWSAYAVKFTGEVDSGAGTSEDEVGGKYAWIALPAGDVGEDLDGPTWWEHGLLEEAQVNMALQAINKRLLVNWNRLAGGGDSGGFIFFNGHIINEPSPGTDGTFDDEENISHLAGPSCDMFEGGEGARWCGVAFEAKTSQTIYAGEQLLWCYGEAYQRNYPVAKICMNDNSREGARIQLN